MTAAPVHLAGERLLLDPAGAIFWPAQRILAVADLHLEKGTACARRGQLVPPFDSRVTLDRLARLIHRTKPATLVAVGDSFHDDAAAARLAPADTARLALLAAETNFVWVRGNHDPSPPASLPGRAATEFSLGPLIFRHQSLAGSGEISGHFHPKARVVTRAGEITRPCFVADANRIMLPAFGAYTGGLDVRSPAIAAIFPRGGRVFLLGEQRLFSFSLGQVAAAACGISV
jgi:DNA ligase-associated metallophosphoesterase